MVPEAKPAVVPSRVTDAPPPANPTPAPQVDLNARAHRVKPGETATSIARRYRISVHRLRRLNPREDLDLLRIGTRLKLR
jgi:LysM repeat protein